MAENYEVLIARIRYHIQKADFMGLKEHEGTLLLNEAADAIEELLAYCNNQEDTIKELVDELEKTEKASKAWRELTVRLHEEKTNRKHGKWTLFENDIEQNAYECSACKDVFVLLEGTPKDNLYNFCPNCGADMREEKK